MAKRTEADVTRDFLRLAQECRFSDDDDETTNGKWERYEVAPSILRPEGVPKTAGFGPADLANSYVAYRSRVTHKLFWHNDKTYFCFRSTNKCESLEEPGKLHAGAIGLAADNGLGFHAINFSQKIAMTRFIEIEFLQSVSLEVDLVFKIKTKERKGRNTSVVGEAVNGATGQIVARCNGVFTSVDIKGTMSNLPYEQVRSGLISAIEEYEASTSEGESMKEYMVREAHMPPWPRLDDESIKRLFPDDILEEVNWLSQSRTQHGIPYDFDETSDTCTTRMRMFKSAKTSMSIALVGYSNQTMGPWTAHGGSTVSMFIQFLLNAAKVTDPSRGWFMRFIHVDYDRPIPISAAYVVKQTEWQMNDNQTELRLGAQIIELSNGKVLCRANGIVARLWKPDAKFVARV